MMPHVHANFVFAHHSAGKAQRNEFGCAHLRLMNKDFTALKDESCELLLLVCAYVYNNTVFCVHLMFVYTVLVYMPIEPHTHMHAHT